MQQEKAVHLLITNETKTTKFAEKAFFCAIYVDHNLRFYGKDWFVQI